MIIRIKPMILNFRNPKHLNTKKEKIDIGSLYIYHTSTDHLLHSLAILRHVNSPILVRSLIHRELLFSDQFLAAPPL